MKIFNLIVPLILLSSCNFKETITSLDVMNETETLVEDIKEEPEDEYKFLGIFTGEKDEAYNQQLSFELYLWELDNKYKGYIYYLWYVTDSNYNEYHSVVSGKQKKDNILLKGQFDSEPVVLTIQDSITPEIRISLRYPTNSGATVNNVKLTLNEIRRKELAVKMDGESAMNKVLDSLSTRKMDHIGY